jgi:hypothetical protein
MTTDVFSTHVFALARALGVLRHALDIDDSALALLASAQLRAAIAKLELAHSQLCVEDRPEADLLLVYVRSRADELLAIAPPHLDGVSAIHDRTRGASPPPRPRARRRVR